MSAVDGLFIILSGAVVVSGLLASVEVDGDGDDDVEPLELDDGGDAGLIVALDDVDDDDVPVLGVVDDDDGDGDGDVDDEDGDGVTTGGVVDVVLVDSR